MSDSGNEAEEETNYELIGVTVHTGTADGGHYYSFIRDRLSQNEMGQDKWSVTIFFRFISLTHSKKIVYWV